jgi:hypothetical protein
MSIYVIGGFCGIKEAIPFFGKAGKFELWGDFLGGKEGGNYVE